MRYELGRGNQIGLKGYFHSNQWLFLAMMISAIVSLVASITLSLEAYELARNPDAIFNCDVNPWLSCGEVARSWQANLFGFPNAFFGMVTEPVVLTIAVAGLGNTKFPRWFMLAANIGYFIGLIFAYWLFYQSVFNIHAMCPWCLTISVFTTITFFTLTHYNMREANFYLPESGQRVVDVMVRMRVPEIAALFCLAVLVLIVLVVYGPQIFG